MVPVFVFEQIVCENESWCWWTHQVKLSVNVSSLLLLLVVVLVLLLLLKSLFQWH